MNSMMTPKSSSESSSYNESPLLARSRASSDASLSTSSYPNPSFFLQSQLFTHLQEEEFGAPINIYREHRGHLEEDKKARTELNTEILNDDLYCPVQQQEVNSNNNNNGKTSRGMNIGNFASFFPRLLPTTFSNFSANNDLESTQANTWDHYHNYHNDMFGINGINGINSVACQ